MKIISIETSCDDTAITIFEAKGGVKNASFKILSNNTNSQIKTHIPYGGVYPMLAKREHIKNLPILFEKSLKKSKISAQGGPASGWKKSPFDLIIVTYGPGLEPCLWAGIDFAKELAKKWSAGRRSAIPIMPANHMEGHIFSVFGKARGKFSISNFQFPTLALLVSGGHTQLVLVKKLGNYEIIGETLDDAVGEAFDKVARMLGLPYPGGPQISKLAESLRAEEKQSLQGVSQAVGPRGSAPRARGDSDPGKIGFSGARSSPFSLPRPMLHSKDFNFSFSGLKTAVLYLTQKIGKPTDKMKAQIAKEFQDAAVECLVYKTAKAIDKYKAKTLVVAGGVAANLHLRKEMSALCGSASGGKKQKIKLLFPAKELTTDNSIMIGIAGYLNYIKNKRKVPKPESIKATGNLKLR